MTKLTKHTTFASLKSSDTKITSDKNLTQLPEIKDFLNTLQKKMTKPVKINKA
jgi:hypothetical protein